LEGFWQNEKYFSDIDEIIRQDFTLKNELSIPALEIDKKIAETESVSIHFRYGDYLFNKKTGKLFGVPDFDYYQTAINKIKSKINNPVFFIFSDDIGLVKKKLQADPFLYFVSQPGLKDFEELILMSRCKHNIVANSSFSWWGGWLNNNPNKIVIAPKIWFRKIKMKDIIPEGWIKI
jgi:hypothetical protein